MSDGDSEPVEDDNQEAPPVLYLITTTGTSVQTANGTWNTSIPNQPLPNYQPLTDIQFFGGAASDTVATGERCADFHVVSEDMLQAHACEEAVIGNCDRCGVRIIIPRVPGAFSFERAGAFVGRAMAIEAEEEVAELLSDLLVLEDQIDRDQKRLRRASEIIQVARTLAQKQAVKQLTAPTS